MAPIAPFFAEWLYKNMTDGMRQEALANNTPLAPESDFARGSRHASD